MTVGAANAAAATSDVAAEVALALPVAFVTVILARMNLVASPLTGVYLLVVAPEIVVQPEVPSSEISQR